MLIIGTIDGASCGSEPLFLMDLFVVLHCLISWACMSAMMKECAKSQSVKLWRSLADAFTSFAVRMTLLTAHGYNGEAKQVSRLQAHKS